MANARDCNVIFVDTTAYTYALPARICGIKYIGAASGTALIKHAATGGVQIYAASGSTDVYDNVEINAKDGLYVEVASGAKLYIYLEV